jgi:hypothetical protein
MPQQAQLLIQQCLLSQHLEGTVVLHQLIPDQSADIYFDLQTRQQPTTRTDEPSYLCSSSVFQTVLYQQSAAAIR